MTHFYPAEEEEGTDNNGKENIENCFEIGKHNNQLVLDHDEL